MNTSLSNEIKDSFEELIKVFSAVKEEDVDKVPFEGSWTAGQTAEHIIKVIGDPLNFLNAKAEPTTDRSYNEKAEQLRNIFLDFSTRMKSPDFVLPLEAHHEKKEVLQIFNQLEGQLVNAAETIDLTFTCKNFELPNLGFLTRMEWITFFITHTKRHTHQLKNILRAFIDSD